MDMDDMVLVSVDDHLCEPPDMFDGHLPSKWRDEAPRVLHTDDGNDVWTFNGAVIPNVGLNAVAGRPKEEYGIEPTAFDEMRPGCFDVHERIRDMDAGGILGSMCFPSFPGFAGRLFAAHPDKAFATDLIRAYNDWHIHEWAGAYPDRFIPMALPMIWSPEECAAEVRRVAELGCHSMTFTENPVPLGEPSFHTDHWDPLWEALVDCDTVLSIHLGSSGQLVFTAPEAPMDVMIQMQPMNISTAASDLLWSTVPRRHPDLRIALSEGGAGWVPYFMDRADKTYEMHHLWTGQDFGDLLPSDVFRRNFLTCFIRDPVGVALRHEIGIGNLCWEMDYPHSDSSWPESPEDLAQVFAGVSDEDIDRITHLNAMDWYSFDPFANRDRSECTVGALRAAAGDHDVSIQSLDKGRHGEKNVSLADFVEQT
ncbi:MAG: amidohydrolase family protein [Vicinamibacterales bacterium]|nr:amidohydrolase family protein [Vicinamibacterales bacterium]